MNANEFVLNKEVTVKVSEGKEVKGILKGISEECSGKITATVEYLTPIRQNFELEKIS